MITQAVSTYLDISYSTWGAEDAKGLISIVQPIAMSWRSLTVACSQGTYLASGSGDSTVRIWQLLGKQKCTATLAGHTQARCRFQRLCLNDETVLRA